MHLTPAAQDTLVFYPSQIGAYKKKNKAEFIEISHEIDIWKVTLHICCNQFISNF